MNENYVFNSYLKDKEYQDKKIKKINAALVTSDATYINDAEVEEAKQNRTDSNDVAEGIQDTFDHQDGQKDVTLAKAIEINSSNRDYARRHSRNDDKRKKFNFSKN